MILLGATGRSIRTSLSGNVRPSNSIPSHGAFVRRVDHFTMHFSEEKIVRGFETTKGAHGCASLSEGLRARQARALFRHNCQVIAHPLLLANREDAALTCEPETARRTAIEIECALDLPFTGNSCRREQRSKLRQCYR